MGIRIDNKAPSRGFIFIYRFRCYTVTKITFEVFAVANYTDITATVIASFRTTMRAFTDTTKWPDDVVEQALYEADAETGGAGWKGFEDTPRNFKRRGMFFYAAHWLATTYTSQTAEDDTNITAAARLNISSKSVGDESIGYRITAMQDTGDDWLSLTQYGVEFYRLRKRAAMGARAV